jgi:hypothetical protein
MYSGEYLDSKIQFPIRESCYPLYSIPMNESFGSCSTFCKYVIIRVQAKATVRIDNIVIFGILSKALLTSTGILSAYIHMYLKEIATYLRIPVVRVFASCPRFTSSRACPSISSTAIC